MTDNKENLEEPNKYYAISKEPVNDLVYKVLWNVFWRALLHFAAFGIVFILYTFVQALYSGQAFVLDVNDPFFAIILLLSLIFALTEMMKKGFGNYKLVVMEKQDA